MSKQGKVVRLLTSTILRFRVQAEKQDEFFRRKLFSARSLISI